MLDRIFVGVERSRDEREWGLSGTMSVLSSCAALVAREGVVGMALLRGLKRKKEVRVRGMERRIAVSGLL